MDATVLVTFATRAGSTAGVANVIGHTLADAGYSVDIRPMHDVTSIEPYQAVVAGSAIRDKQWLPEAMTFIEDNQAALRRRPFAAFLVCITLAMPGADEYRPFVLDFLKPVRALVPTVSEGLFAGVLDYTRLPLVPEGVQMRILSATSHTPPGDYRDWDEIRLWAASLVGRLQIAQV
jgi:menaquinone-dependent protoporphyrinogen oxidase